MCGCGSSSRHIDVELPGSASAATDKVCPLHALIMVASLASNGRAQTRGLDPADRSSRIAVAMDIQRIRPADGRLKHGIVDSVAKLTSTTVHDPSEGGRNHAPTS
jgi:hypothetical protein